MRRPVVLLRAAFVRPAVFELERFELDRFELERFEPERFVPERFVPDRFELDRFELDRFEGGGTLPPFSRASDSPIAIACLRLVTFFPLPPLRSVPRLRRRIALSTFF